MTALARALKGPVKRLRDAPRRWAKRRQGDDGRRVVLSSRRVYILPNSVGVTLGLAAFVMLLGSMNYNNSLAFALTFSLAAIGLVAMHHTHGNLANVVVRPSGAEPVFAGDDVHWRVIVENPSATARYDLVLSSDDDTAHAIDVAPAGSASVVLTQTAPARGRLAQPRFRIRSQYPLGLFVAWGWLHPTTSVLIWPQPASKAELPRPGPGHAGDLDLRTGDEDFAGLRDYQPGDPPSRIAWRTLARAGELATKSFAGAGSGPVWLDLADYDAGDTETALAIVARLVIDAEAAGLAFGLLLGGQRLEPAAGRAHRNRCLDALAVYGLADAPSAR